MLLNITFFLGLVLYSTGYQIITRENGYFITGEGCGIKTQMKTLQKIPEDIQKHPCTMIPFQKSYQGKYYYLLGLCLNINVAYQSISAITKK